MSLRKKFLAATVLAGAATALLSSGAMAYDGKWYAGLGAGWTHMDDDWSKTQFKISDGYIVDGRVGVMPTDSIFRYEFDLSYRDTKADKIGATPVGGYFKIWSGILDVIYDFKTGSPLRPYIGAGGGVANISYRANGTGFNYSGTSGKLAGQLLAGLAWDFSPTLSANLEYRYFAMNEAKFEGVSGGVPVKLRESFANHAVLAGLTWTFGEAAPPPAPPAPPPVAAPPPPALPVFKIFFPWNQYKLTPEAKKTVDEIASQYKDKKITRINIQGNTDTSGSSDYNMGLGDKRAAAVKAELIAQGIPDSVISTESLGETNPAVQTGDNVREPLNRRAEVTIQVQ